MIRGKILPDAKLLPDNNDTKMKLDGNDTSIPNMKVYRVRIEKIFKGGETMTGPTKRTEILVSRLGETCGIPLQEGEVYVMTGEFSVSENECECLPIDSDLRSLKGMGIDFIKS